MIYKMWLFLKNYLNYQKDNILNCFFNEKKKLKQLKIENLEILQNLFGHEEEENCYKTVRANNLWSNNHIKFENNGDKNKTLSVKEYLNKVRPYLKDINK